MAHAPLTYDHLRSRKKPNIKRVPIALDADVADEYAEAKSEYDAARASLEVRNNVTAQERLIAAEDRLEQAKAAADESTVVFVFKSIGRQAFEEMMDLHPATKQQREQAKRQGNVEANWNTDTFPVALIAASALEPEMTEAEVKEMWLSPDWNQAELLALFFGALEANSERRTVDLRADGTGRGRH